MTINIQDQTTFTDDRGRTIKFREGEVTPSKVISYDKMNDALESIYTQYARTAKKLMKPTSEISVTFKLIFVNFILFLLTMGIDHSFVHGSLKEVLLIVVWLIVASAISGQILYNDAHAYDAHSLIPHKYNLDSSVVDDMDLFHGDKTLLVDNMHLYIMNPFDSESPVDPDLNFIYYYQGTDSKIVLPLVLTIDSLPVALITHSYKDKKSKTESTGVNIIPVRSPEGDAFWQTLNSLANLTLYYKEKPYYGISLNYEGYDYLITAISIAPEDQVIFKAKLIAKTTDLEVKPEEVYSSVSVQCVPDSPLEGYQLYFVEQISPKKEIKF